MKCDLSSKEYMGLEFSYMESVDMDDVERILLNPKVCEYLFFAPISRENLEGYMTSYFASNQKQLIHHVFVIKKDRKFVGYCGLTAVDYI